jgi:hypothetical protein
MRCEDYPCCGHTDNDPCDRQWYDEPGAFDTSIRGNEHALCEHEFGFCEVDAYDDEEEDGDLNDDGADHEQWETTTPAEVYMTDEDYERRAYNREAEEQALGRPLFPNEY